MKSSSDLVLAPVFSAEQFRAACLSIAESYRRSGTEARWTPASADAGYLLVQQTFNAGNHEPSRLVRTDYHVLLSPTWQVPVLHFAPMWADTLEPLTLTEIYNFLVAKSSKDALQNVGVLGGISHGDHPFLGIPFYYIHPCGTADLLNDIQEENTHISREKLLRIWLGLVGGVIDIPAPSPSS